MNAEQLHATYSDDVRLALLEQSINNINNTLLRIEKRFDHIDNEFKGIRNEFNGELKGIRNEFCSEFKGISNEFNSEFKGVNREIRGIRAEMKNDFRWLVTIFGGLILGLSGVMAHGFHWI